MCGVTLRDTIRNSVVVVRVETGMPLWIVHVERMDGSRVAHGNLVKVDVGIPQSG